MAEQLTPPQQVVNQHRSRLLEWLAPFEPVLHQLFNGTDERSFWQRFYDADVVRGERASRILWSRRRNERSTLVELQADMTLTHFGLGLAIEVERASDYNPGHCWIGLMIGPFGLTLATETPAQVRRG